MPAVLATWGLLHFSKCFHPFNDQVLSAWLAFSCTTTPSTSTELLLIFQNNPKMPPPPGSLPRSLQLELFYSSVSYTPIEPTRVCMIFCLGLSYISYFSHCVISLTRTEIFILLAFVPTCIWEVYGFGLQFLGLFFFFFSISRSFGVCELRQVI